MKKIILIFLILFVFFGLSAMEYSQAVAKAKEMSTTMQYYNSSYEYQSRMLLAEDLKDRLAFGISVSGIEISEDSNYYPTTKLIFTLPEYVEDLTIEATLDASHTKETPKVGESFNIKPGISVDKTFDFKDYEDTQEDLAKEKNRNMLDSAYEKQVLSFENSLIDSLIDIMTLKASIRKQKTDFSKMETNYDANIKIGNIDSNSLADVSAQKAISQAKTQLEKTENSLNTALENFENTFGFPYEDVSVVPEADLSFVPQISKSVTVRNAEIDLETAKQKLDEKLGNKTTLTLGANADYSMDFDGDGKYADSSSNLSTGASASFNYKNLSLKASYSGTITKDDFTPSLTISGGWNNDAKPKEKSDLEIIELQNRYIKARDDYDSAVFAYDSQSKALSKEIETLQTDFAMQDIDDYYDWTVLTYKQDLFDKGLITLTELNEAKTEVELDAAERIALELKALKLQNKIIMNNL